MHVKGHKTIANTNPTRHTFTMNGASNSQIDHSGNATIPISFTKIKSAATKASFKAYGMSGILIVQVFSFFMRKKGILSNPLLVSAT